MRTGTHIAYIYGAHPCVDGSKFCDKGSGSNESTKTCSTWYNKENWLGGSECMRFYSVSANTTYFSFPKNSLKLTQMQSTGPLPCQFPYLVSACQHLNDSALPSNNQGGWGNPRSLWILRAWCHLQVSSKSSYKSFSILSRACKTSAKQNGHTPCQQLPWPRGTGVERQVLPRASIASTRTAPHTTKPGRTKHLRRMTSKCPRLSNTGNKTERDQKDSRSR